MQLGLGSTHDRAPYVSGARIPRPGRVVWMLALAASWAMACATTTTPPSPEALLAGPLSVLVDGRTTREEVVLRYGVPARTFEADRLLVYRLGWSEEAGLRPLAWHAPDLAGFDLVLVFDPMGVLTRHALVAR